MNTKEVLGVFEWLTLMIICSRCGETRGEDEFYIKKNGKRWSGCKACHRAASTRWRNKNLECARESSRDWCAAHPEYYRQKRREWYLRNQEQCKQKARERRARIRAQ